MLFASIPDDSKHVLSVIPLPVPSTVPETPCAAVILKSEVFSVGLEIQKHL